MNILKFISISILILLVDQVSKYLARHWFRAQLNTGGIFGLGEQWNWLLLSLLLIGVITLNLRHWTHNHPLEKVGWTVILSAGFSNIIDRIFFGGVWDWIVYPVINIVGNIADILLGLGVLILLVAQWTDRSSINLISTSQDE